MEEVVQWDEGEHQGRRGSMGKKGASREKGGQQRRKGQQGGKGRRGGRGREKVRRTCSGGGGGGVVPPSVSPPVSSVPFCDGGLQSSVFRETLKRYEREEARGERKRQFCPKPSGMAPNRWRARAGVGKYGAALEFDSVRECPDPPNSDIGGLPILMPISGPQSQHPNPA